MKRTRTLLLALIIPLVLAPALLPAGEATTGLVRNDPGTAPGCTLISPLFSTESFLIDLDGRVVHRWKREFPPGQSTYLLDNGHLLATANPGPQNQTVFRGGGAGGRIQEYDWDGTLVWDYEFAGEGHLQHHDIEPMPNGNVLILAWELKTEEETLAAGRDPELLGEHGLWPDMVAEVRPEGKTGGTVVWEWHAWDHLVQEHDRSKANYGSVAGSPRRIDLNPGSWESELSADERKKLEALGYLQPEDSDRGGHDKGQGHGASPDFMHSNSVDYNAGLDQVLISVLGYNEVWVIDHATTTAEAAGPRGDLLYRYGNPAMHGAGTAEDQQLFAQHDARWIPGDDGGPDHILVFNNGRGRPGGDWSSVVEIVPPVDAAGRYAWPESGAPGPAEPVWRYSAPEKGDFYSHFISGAERLGNGNTLICSGANGRIFEVMPAGDIVWEYRNPVEGDPMSLMAGRTGSHVGPPQGMRPPGGRGPGGGPPPGMGPHEGMMPPPEMVPEPFRELLNGGRISRLMLNLVRALPPPMMGGPGGPGGPQQGNQLFRAARYAADSPALAGRDLSPGQTLEAFNASTISKARLDPSP